MVLALVVNANIMANGFVYDDVPQIEQNPWLRDPASLPRAFTTNVWGFAAPQATSNFYRPAMHALNLAIFQVAGRQAWAFHLVSLLLHALCTLLVWFVVMELSGDARAALWAELFFAVHPIHVEPVAWIAASPDLACTFFVLAAFLLHVRGRTWAAWILFFVALMCKETAVVLPVLVFAYEFGRRDVLRKYGGYVIAFAMYVPLRIAALHGWTSPHSIDRLQLNEIQRFYSSFALFGRYLLKLVVPLPLSILPTFHASTLFDWRFWAGLAAFAAMIALGRALWRAGKREWMAIVWMVAPILVPIAALPYLGGNTFGERYLYLPSIGFCWLLGAVLARRAKEPAILYGGALALVAAVLSWTAAPIFHDDVSLWEHADSVDRDSPSIHSWLAQAYLYAGRNARALELFEQAVREDPTRPGSQNGYGIALATAGRLDEARAALERADALAPQSGVPALSLGLLDERDGDLAAAEREYRRAIVRDPELAAAHRYLGILLLKENRLDEADAEFRKGGQNMK